MSWIFVAGLGHASVQAVYSYLGYYNVCNLGGEMKDPGKNIPRAIFISIVGVAILYFAMQTSILGVVPWQEAARSQGGRQRICRTRLWIELGLRRDRPDPGYRLRLDLFRYARLLAHPLRCRARRQLLLHLRAAFIPTSDSRTSRCSPSARPPFFSAWRSSLGQVIRAILAMRCLIQFVAQALGLMLLHRRWKAERWPFRMWLPTRFRCSSPSPDGWQFLFRRDARQC